MVRLMFNTAIRIIDVEFAGFYRVVAVPPGADHVWFAFIAPVPDRDREAGEFASPEPNRIPAVGAVKRVAYATLTVLQQQELLAEVDLHPSGKLLANPDSLKASERTLWEKRCATAQPFLDQHAVCCALEDNGGITRLVREILRSKAGSRAGAYRIWALLCRHGFDRAALIPRFDRCGAPGLPRPVGPSRRKAGAKTKAELTGIVEAHPQIGTTAEVRALVVAAYRVVAKPGKSFPKIYREIVSRLFVRGYTQTDTGLVPVPPEQGSFPNQRQVRHIIESEFSALARLRNSTTTGHYQRNLRGLTGKSQDNVFGPGVAYAMDSTVGDVYLRSALNRAWFIGRPVVYVLVDVWSTAIVGFHVCLAGPSWTMAKLGLFAAAADPKLMAQLWGYEYVPVLDPAPTLPRHLWCDRGEYLSLGARATAEALALTVAINPSYRPDYKGIVEVLHRIGKDEQFGHVPGSFDARRKELELKGDIKASTLTLREYACYLRGIFDHYNLHADRNNKLTAEMIAAGAHPSPAGLWHYGHANGFGYQKAFAPERLMRELQVRTTAVSRRDGVFMESLQYESDVAVKEEWSARARNFHSRDLDAYHFPGSTSCIWIPDASNRLCEFQLRANARAPGDITLEDWRDALALRLLQHTPADRAHAALVDSLQRMANNRQLFERAETLTREAEARMAGQRPTTHIARLLEQTGAPPESSVVSAPAPTPSQPGSFGPEHERSLDALFAQLNRMETT